MLVAVALALSCVAGWLLACAMRCALHIVSAPAWTLAVTLRCIPFFCLAIFGVWLVLLRLDIPFSGSRYVAFTAAVVLLACFPMPRIAEAYARRSLHSTWRDVATVTCAWIAKSLPSVVAAALIAEMFFGIPGQGRMLEYLHGSNTVIVALDAIIFLGIRAALSPWMPQRSDMRDGSRTFRKGSVAIVYVCGIALIAILIASVSLRETIFFIDTHWAGAPLPPCFLNGSACAGHVLGTDEVGRDLAARVVVGLRNTLSLGLWTLVLEAALAALAVVTVRRHAMLRYWTSRVMDAVSSLLPWPLVALASILVPTPIFGESVLVPISAALVLCSRSLPAVLASRISAARIAELALIDLCRAIVLLATVDFFGYGMLSPHPSLGNMLANAEAMYESGPWVIFFPAIILVAVTLSIEVIRRLAIRAGGPGDAVASEQAQAS